ncbi:unnamed protein product [Soboliphyme baturini]|uniref:Transposase n=1 Tax=Soboliphyme baturini TaxID=241478 RepID=A0A183J014_9BILA|nr:unnamed protein product [Soboliphyme baturini]
MIDLWRREQRKAASRRMAKNVLVLCERIECLVPSSQGKCAHSQSRIGRHEQSRGEKRFFCEPKLLSIRLHPRSLAFAIHVLYVRRSPATGHQPPATGHRPPAPGDA